MKSKPVRKYAQPKYPTRLEIAARPALLHRHQPPAWRKWPELTGAAGLFLLADTARLSAADSSPKGGPNPTQTKAVAVVAPIFVHGEGRGATGCIVMSPPVFLSEEEALLVIREEMGTIGVHLRTNQKALAGVTVERGVLSAPANPSGVTKGTPPARPTFQIKQEPFKTDAADPKKKVFIEFLGERDADRWDRERQKEEGKFYGSTVRSYDLPRTAAYVAERVKRQATDKLYFGAFYDPLARPGFSRAPTAKASPGEAKSAGAPVNVRAEYLGHGRTDLTLLWSGGPLIDAKAESRRLLRLQVQDFLKWLQAQGAI